MKHSDYPEPKPMRHKQELVGLSRDHHEGLLLCWKITSSIERGISPDRIGAYVLHFFNTNLAPHFEIEERTLFPLLPSGHPQRKQAVREHAVLKDMISEFRSAHEFTVYNLKQFAFLLNGHIRFEERVLFGTIEKSISQELLIHIEKKHARTVHASESWTDTFWIQQK
jgi:hemerythrin-like domain-containing protein